LIEQLKDRKKFKYSVIVAIKEILLKLICKGRNYSHREFFRLGKTLVEKQLDITKVMNELR